jgi:UDP-N-acetylglucosamine:LPS N-acetylglucosamine transferase
MKKPRVLLTYIESGMGHIMSMKAIAESLEKYYPNQLELLNVEVMKDGNEKTRIDFEKFLCDCTKLTNKSKAFGMGIFAFLEGAGNRHFMRLVHKTLFRKASNSTIEEMRKYNPDVIVSTHYFITYCAVELKKRYMPNLIVITYNPDNNVHMWWDNRSDLFINNNEMACDEAIRHRKFNFSNVRRVYFTARDEVAKASETKEFYRKKYNIDNKFTVCIADGAYASAKAKKYCNKLLKIKIPINILLIAGKNEKCYKYFMNKKKKLKDNINLEVFKFTPLAYELYGASDIFITKAGPNAILDSLFMGTPVCVDYYAHPIEKATTKLFVNELHCGIKVFNAQKIRKKIEYLYNHPLFLEELQKNIKKSVDKNNNGAKQIADLIMNEIKK